MSHSSSVLLNRLLARGKFRHFQVLLGLVELGSVQRTADAIGMTQSSVTQSLAYIELLLEMPLFHRHPKGVRPTDACLDLLPVVRQVMAGLTAGAETMAARHNAGHGTVRLFASAAATNGLLLPALPEFNDQHPGILVQLHEAEREDLLLAVTGGEADMAACRRPPVVPTGWSFRSLVEDHFVVVCATDHPLAGRKRVRWKDLAHQSWLLSPAGTAARERFDALAGELPTPVQTHPLVTRSLSAIFWLLRNRAQLGFLPYRFVKHLVDDQLLATVALSPAITMEPIGLLLPDAEVRAAPSVLATFLVERAAGP